MKKNLLSPDTVGRMAGAAIRLFILGIFPLVLLVIGWVLVSAFGLAWPAILTKVMAFCAFLCAPCTLMVLIIFIGLMFQYLMKK